MTRKSAPGLLLLVLVPTLSCSSGSGPLSVDAGRDTTGAPRDSADLGRAAAEDAADGAPVRADGEGPVAVDPEFDKYIVFMEPDVPTGTGTFGKLLFAAKRAGETTWVISELDAGLYVTKGTTNASLALALDSAGRPHVAYMAFSAEQLRYTRFDGSAWVKAEGTPGYDLLDSKVIGLNAKHFLVLENDLPRLAFRQDTNLVYYAFDGSAWQREVAVAFDPTSGEGSPGGSPALVLDPSGQPHVAHHDGHGFFLRYAHREAGGWLDQPVSSSPDMIGEYKNIAVDVLGLPHIVFSQGYTRFDGTTWVNAAGKPGYDAIASDFVSSAFSSDGEIVVGEKQGTDVVLRRKTLASTTWEGAGTVTGGAACVDIVADRHGRPHLAVTRPNASDSSVPLVYFRPQDGGWVGEVVYYHDGFLRVVHPSLALRAVF